MQFKIRQKKKSQVQPGIFWSLGLKMKVLMKAQYLQPQIYKIILKLLQIVHHTLLNQSVRILCKVIRILIISITGNVTSNTLNNMKEFQQTTVNTVVKPMSQATSNAMHKIGDLQVSNSCNITNFR